MHRESKLVRPSAICLWIRRSTGCASSRNLGKSINITLPHSYNRTTACPGGGWDNCAFSQCSELKGASSSLVDSVGAIALQTIQSNSLFTVPLIFPSQGTVWRKLLLELHSNWSAALRVAVLGMHYHSVVSRWVVNWQPFYSFIQDSICTFFAHVNSRKSNYGVFIMAYFGSDWTKENYT